MKLVKDTDNKNLQANKVSDKEAEEAFKTILAWMGEAEAGREQRESIEKSRKLGQLLVGSKKKS